MKSLKNGEVMAHHVTLVRGPNVGTNRSRVSLVLRVLSPDSMTDRKILS